MRERNSDIVLGVAEDRAILLRLAELELVDEAGVPTSCPQTGKSDAQSSAISTAVLNLLKIIIESSREFLC